MKLEEQQPRSKLGKRKFYHVALAIVNMTKTKSKTMTKCSNILSCIWTGGLDWQAGLVDWTGGLDWQTRLMDGTTESLNFTTNDISWPQKNFLQNYTAMACRSTCLFWCL